jgi:lysophospholipase L1-like esterase/pimeloyl-ACP methyl ester carboxylesterase
MKKSKTSILIIFLMPMFSAFSQDAKTVWDNTVNKNWPNDFKLVEIKSSADESIQKAWVFTTNDLKPQPLIVSLHTWSGDYNQEDPLAKEVQLRNWNFIHPDFRGPNNRPEACGSDLVISDIKDVIEFAIQTGKVDINNMHIIGASGGGYATMMAFQKLQYKVKSFNAWVGISDLEKWYWESKGRGQKYSTDIEMVTTGGKGFDPADAKMRSPIHFKYNLELRSESFLNIYTGIHDGYTGSVPISQSIEFYNKILQERYPDQVEMKIADSTIIQLLASRTKKDLQPNYSIGDRKVHIRKQLPKLSLTIFEGGHEMIVPQALALIPVYDKKNDQQLNILTIGDSNAAAIIGWPNQLKKLLPFSAFSNQSIAGNTIGFDNLDQEKLNTLKNIEQYLGNALIDLRNTIDIIVIGLGTNDSKSIFEKQQKEVPENLDLLIKRINQYFESKQLYLPKIVILSPPPVDETKADYTKYGRSDQRIQINIPKFRKISNANQAIFIDAYSQLKPSFSELTTDGVHLNELGQFKLASFLHDVIAKSE